MNQAGDQGLRPPICNLKKYGWLEKIRAIFGLAELSRKLKKIGMITNILWLLNSADYKQFRLSC